MRSLKIRLLIGLLTFGIGALAVRTCLLPEQVENLSATSVQVSPEKPVVPDSVFDRAERNDKLQAEADALLSLFDDMPPVPVYIKDEPILKSGANTERGVAYTHCEKHEFPAIFVKRIFYQKANRKQLVNALKHELTHAWLCRQQMMQGHDERFRQKFSQIGGFGN